MRSTIVRALLLLLIGTDALKCRYLCMRFGAKSLGPAFAEVSTVDECTRRCSEDPTQVQLGKPPPRPVGVAAARLFGDDTFMVGF
mmetsp:Transcript_24305/g.72434  ORF Transcript_24305/g.72434 Transcript_24305/m.72434 type:complete len:85 (-) Transcript_24305:74-328(-)